MKTSLIWTAVCLCALIGPTARPARAAGIVMQVAWAGGSLTFDSSMPSPFVLTGSSATDLLLNNAAVNAYMSAHGSEITIPGLNASTNFPGGNPDPTRATLTVGGTATLNGEGTATSVAIKVTEAGFSKPTGLPGTLTNVQTAILSSSVTPIDADGKNQTSVGSYDTTFTPSVSTSKSAVQSSHADVAGIASFYTLGSLVTIDMTGSAKGDGTTDQFQALTTLVSVIPEPTGAVLMLTGMPVLLVLGVLSRLRARTGRQKTTGA